MQSGLVSVIIPCYNYEKYVSAAIKSVLNQDYKNIELIVIDDGSTDNSAKIIQDLASKHGFTFINQENAGVTATCQRGLELARGEFIKFFDADDVLSPDFISKTFTFLQANPQYAMVYSRAFLIDKAGNKIAGENKKCKNCLSGFIFDELVRDCFIILPTTLIKTQAVRDVGGFDLGIGLQDYQLWLKIARKYQIGYLDKALCFYRDHGVSLSKNHSFMIKRVHQTYELFATEPSVQKKLRRVYPLWFRILSKTSDKPLAKKYMRLAFKSAWWSYKFWYSVIRTYLK